jgi:selenophosphate synthase
MMFEEIIEKVKYYKKLGVNPLSLATGCAVKVDLIKVVYPALKELRPKLEGMGFTIASREDADIFHARSEGVEVHRRIYSLGQETEVDPEDIKKISPERAITVVQIYQRYADEPKKFAELIRPVYEKIALSGVRINLGKGHSIETPFKDDQFILFDFLKPQGKPVDGFTAANNDTMHIIDPTDEPGSYRQVAGALSNTLNDLFVLGFYRNLKIIPVINAPNKELKERMWSNAEGFAKKIGAELLEAQQPGKGRLLIGATVIGDLDKHPPVFYDKARPGMKLVATRPFGELASINVYIAAVIDETVIHELEENGISLEMLEKLKEDAVTKIATPNIAAAETIYKYLPRTKAEFKVNEHIIATTDVTGPGIYVVRELAELMNAKFKLWDIPLLYPELSEYATKNYIIPNATAGTNGSFIVVVPDEIVDDFVNDLKSKGLQPIVFGEIIEIGGPEVIVPAVIKKYVADVKILSKFNTGGNGND